MNDDLHGRAVRANDLFEKIRSDNPEIGAAEDALGSRLTLARHVLRLRTRLGWTQRHVARVLGVRARRIAEIEAARASIGLDLVDRLAKVFEIAPAALLEPRHDDGGSPRAALNDAQP